ncbi:MAG: murein biosynthesis integral membrane protein MurJ [Anaerolineae bacterium]|nr:murein biosynthesis integral membrane protein MurJ [Anaerolineae bacterium]
MTAPGTPQTLNTRQIRLASLVVAFSFVLSGGLGIIRQALIGAAFGGGSELDAFYAAYRIPELLFTLVAGGALGSAFIPVFSGFLGRGETDRAWRLASAVMTLVGLIAAVAALLAAIFSDAITRSVLIPAAPPAQQALTADLMRTMLVTVVIFSISGLIMGILNAHQRFLAPALAPSFYNIGLILGVLLLAPSLGVHGLAYGAVIGAALHFLVQLPALRAIRPRLSLWRAPTAPGVGEVLRLMGPRIVGQAAVQINFVVNMALASGMAAGSVTALAVAFNLMYLVLAVVGQSVGTAIFPTLALIRARDDWQPDFRRTLAGALRGALFLAVPATVGIILLAQPLVAAVYERGAWTAHDSTAAAWALSFYAIGLCAFVLQEVLARAFYALHDTLTPVAIAVGGVLLNLALSLILIRVIGVNDAPFGEPVHPFSQLSLWTPTAGQGPFGGLALANALATTVESALLWALLRRRTGGLEDRAVLGTVGRAALASLPMALGVLLVATVDMHPFLKLAAGGVVGVLIYGLAALALRMPEAQGVISPFLRRLRKTMANE